MPDDTNSPSIIYAINERLRKRIGAKDYLRKMEGVTRKYDVSFGHPDVKRAFERFFYMTAAHIQVISVVGRTRLPDEVITLVEQQIREAIEKATTAVTEDIDACGALMQANGIGAIGDALAPLHVTVQVTSPLMRRYLEFLQKCDQLEMMIDTLVIDEVVAIDRAENQKRRAKKLIRSVPLEARQWQLKIRKQLQEAEEREAVEEAAKNANRRAKPSKASTTAREVDQEPSTTPGKAVDTHPEVHEATAIA
jgi:hypothetical protein